MLPLICEPQKDLKLSLQFERSPSLDVLQLVPPLSHTLDTVSWFFRIVGVTSQ